jgi:fructose-1,6-bisphosphatase/inositol monophosphatase family enzyme
MQHSALLNVMIAAARKAARTLKRDFGEVEHLQVSLKGPANFVTAADRRAEETLRSELAKARPRTCGFALETAVFAVGRPGPRRVSSWSATGGPRSGFRPREWRPPA